MNEIGGRKLDLALLDAESDVQRGLTVLAVPTDDLAFQLTDYAVVAVDA